MNEFYPLDNQHVDEGDQQDVVCPECGMAYLVPETDLVATCPRCGTEVNL